MPGRTISGARFASGGLSIGVSRREIVQRAVAILAKNELHEIRASLCDEVVDPQARVIAATVGQLRVFSIYAPNGQAVGSPAYEYKLHWYRRLLHCLAKRKIP